MADKAYITPNVLKWARESARISEEAAAAKVYVSLSRLQEWEAGTNQPTIAQAQTLAKFYKRPFAVFFLPDIPRDFQPLQDFRKKDAKILSTGSIFIIREIQQKQSWISEMNRDNEEPKLPFVGQFSMKDDPVVIANDILTTLGIIPGNYGNRSPFKEWVDKAEARGIYISRSSFIHTRLKLDSEELQGFAIADEFAPFIFINSDDWDAPQLFTLVHELAHIWIAETGISSDVVPELEHREKYHPVELFCNEVAANALMPKKSMNNIDRHVFSNAKAVFSLAKNMGVSSFALLVRALNLNIISIHDYQKLKREADMDFHAFLIREEEKKARQKDKAGGPNPYLLRLNRNSRLFTQTVLDAYRGGFIEPTQASNLLNVQTNKFKNLEAQLYQ